MFKKISTLLVALVAMLLVACGGGGEKAAVKGEKGAAKEEAKLGEELVKDGNFPPGSVKKYSVYNGLTDAIKAEVGGKWTFHVTMPADGTGEVVDGAFVVKVKSPGNDNWQLQLVQFPIPVKFGKQYRLYFEAKAEAPRSIFVKVGRIGGDWLAYSGLRKYDLTTEWQKFETIFKSIGGDDFARLEFNVSGDPNGVSIRNVSVREVLK